MQDGGRLTRIFVKHFLYHTHGQIQVVYRTDSTNYELSQKDSKIRGLRVGKVLYSDIYEEGLVDRLEKEINQLEDYYKELDKETKVD